MIKGGLRDYLNEEKIIFDYSVILKRLSYGSFVGGKNKFLYLETPKCACSTMKKIVASLEGFNIEERQVGAESSPKMSMHKRKFHPLPNLNSFSKNEIEIIMKDPAYVRFCIVRNPYARLASAWSDKIRQMEPTHFHVIKEIRQFHNILDTEHSPTFDEFVIWVVSRDSDLECDAHWESMINLLLPKIINYTHVLRTESLIQDFQKVLDDLNIETTAVEILDGNKTNESLPIDWKEVYSEKTAELAYLHFEADFKYYGYDKDSWLENSISSLSTSDELIKLQKKLKKLESNAVDGVVNRNKVIYQLLEKIKCAEMENNTTIHKIIRKINRLF